MDRKHVLLAVLLVSFLGIVVYMSRDWAEPPDLQIGLTISPNLVPADKRAALGPAVQRQRYTVLFTFNRQCTPESVKVVKVHEIETNRFAHPVWELVAGEEPEPVKSITYGVPVRGMQPRTPGDQAEVLQPRVPYRLLLETKGLETSYDFSVGNR
jgi:hypothetical protein